MAPLSAQLFIIYGDYAMEIYTSDVNNAGISKTQSIIGDDKTEHSWANYILKLKFKNQTTPVLNGITNVQTIIKHVI